METNYHIVQLSNKMSLVGDIEYTAEGLVIKFPLEVTAKPINDESGKVIGEHMVLRPFLVMTDDREVVIDLFNVICYNRLSSRLNSSYEDMVENVYGKAVAFDGDFLSKNNEKDTPKEIENLSAEEAKDLKDQVDNILENLSKKDGDNTLH